MEDKLQTADSFGHRVVPGRVTVVTAVYNAAHTLVRCIESVRSQDYPDIEHIVMDGGSTDGSLDILRQYNSCIVWRSEPDKGIYDAWNKSLALATGEWIAFLGSEDFYLPGAITAYMNSTGLGATDYISSWVRWVQPSGKAATIGHSWRWPQFQAFMTTAHVGSMHRYTLFQTYGTYDTAYQIVGDYELLLRPKGALRAAFLPQVTAEMQAGGASDSFAALREARRAKTTTGGRNPAITYIELWIARLKLAVWRLLAHLPSRGMR